MQGRAYPGGKDLLGSSTIPEDSPEGARRTRPCARSGPPCTSCTSCAACRSRRSARTPRRRKVSRRNSRRASRLRFAGPAQRTPTCAGRRARPRAGACATASGPTGRRRPGSSCAELGRLQAARGPPRCRRARPAPECRGGRPSASCRPSSSTAPRRPSSSRTRARILSSSGGSAARGVGGRSGVLGGSSSIVTGGSVARAAAARPDSQFK